MRPRGHGLLLLFGVIAAALAAFMVMASRLSQSHASHRLDLARTQALWLARSAATHPTPGARTVDTALGPATVRVTRTGPTVTADAELRGGRAVVTATAEGQRLTDWTERFERR
jgi:hypothetical protein